MPATPNMLQKGRSVHTASSLLFFIFGFTSPSYVAILLYIMENHELPFVFGIRALGGGFIESLGMDAMILSILLLIALYIVGLAAGHWLWRSQRRGGKLGIALLLLEMVFVIGFLVPILMVIVPVRVVLIGWGWKSLQ